LAQALPRYRVVLDEFLHLRRRAEALSPEPINLRDEDSLIERIERA
jgi:hypothetical protein